MTTIRQPVRGMARRGLLAGAALAAALALAGCGALSTIGQRGPAPAAYDLGDPPMLAADAPAPAAGAVPLAIPDVDATGAISGAGIIYRFGGIQAWQPRAYTQARWMRSPTELLRLRAQQRLAASRPVVLADEIAGGAVLQLALEDFSQRFDTPQSSSGVVRLRATLLRGDGTLLAQRVFEDTEPAASADAAGGVQALARASDRVLDGLAAWVDAALAH